MGRTDYCNSLLCGLPDKSVFKLLRVQDAATRLVIVMSLFCHITPVLFSLHWLPVKERIRYKIIILTFKAIYGLTPTYLCSFVSIQRPSIYSLRRNDDLYLSHSMLKHRKQWCDRSFALMTPSIFNALPRHIRHEKNFPNFKSLVKTFCLN